jgi:hypothetical protein
MSIAPIILFWCQAFPRKGYAIEKVIEKRAAEGLRISAQVVAWEKMETVSEKIVEKFQQLKI